MAMEYRSSFQAGRKANKIIAVMSGKGGVGKSTIAGLLAVGFRRQGLRVGVLDGDLISPSLVSMFGMEMQFSLDEDGAVEPLKSHSGVKVMSMNLFQASTSDPLVWRGPMISSAFKQFYSEISWGQLDYLFIDVPTGTSDVPMTVLHSLPLDGIIVVSSPQKLARAVTQRCVNMIHQLNGRILGVIENSLLFIGHDESPDSDSARSLVEMTEAPLLTQLPFDPRLTALCDAGQIEAYHAEVLETLIARLTVVLTDEE